MLQAYREGKDLHRLTAATIYGCQLDEVTREQRQAGKSCNFGLLYGQSASGLRSYANSNYGVQMSVAQAKTFRSSFFQLYQGLKRWHQTTLNNLRKGQFYARTRGGRLRLWQKEKPPWLGHVLNTPVQGTAADGMKEALIRLHQQLRPFRSEARVVHLVHDEIILEVLEQRVDEASIVLKDCMVQGMKRFLTDVPVEVEVQKGRSWAAK